MDYHTIIVERKDHIGKITLNRPEKLNALTTQMGEELNNALLELEADNEVHVAIIKGAGRAFCAGVDIDEVTNKTVLEVRNRFQTIAQFMGTIPNMTKPVIAQVHGHATAAGCGIVCACDLVVASDESLFGTTAINVGMYCFGPSAPLSHCLGRKRSLEMLLTGDLVDAQEAYRIGLINKVVPKNELEQATMELAQKLASKSPIAMQMGKQSFYTMSDMEYNKALKYLGEISYIQTSSEDAQEGIRAFLQKRAPQWKGR